MRRFARAAEAGESFPGESSPAADRLGASGRGSSGSGGGEAAPAVGIEFLDAQTLLVWTQAVEDPVLGIMDTESGRFQELGIDFDTPLKQVSRFPQGIIVVDESGECMILDPYGFQPRFRYRSPGMNKVVFAVGDTLVGGRTSLSTFGSPLLQINERTGETVAISDPSLFVYNLIFEPRDASLFSVSVDGRGDSGRTLFKVHSGYGFERNRVLFEYRGEDLAAVDHERVQQAKF